VKAWLALPAALLVAGAGRAAPLELFNNRPFVTVEVNGHRTVALLDSAAELTLVDNDLAARLGLSAAEQVTAHGSGANALAATLANPSTASIRFGTWSLTGPTAILDLDEVSGRLIGRHVDLILGRELFDANVVRIDLQRRTVAIGTRPGRRGVRLPLGEHRGTPTVPAAVEGHEAVRAVFDTGNGSLVMVGAAYARRIGLTGARIIGHEEGGGLGGAVLRDIVVLRSLTLAGRTFRNVRAAIDPGETASDLNIGTSILRHFLITADFPRHAIWLEPRT
jgi:predicted aspartyl protease